MPQELSRSDLDQARTLLNSSGPSAMYDYLSGKGYTYATLANGVAKGDTLAGVAAINFMKANAAKSEKAFTDADMERVLKQMAYGYFNILEQNLNKNTNNKLSADITVDEAWAFHRQVFESNGLSVEAWTLNAVLLVVRWSFGHRPERSQGPSSVAGF